jgi:hypothetical protein
MDDFSDRRADIIALLLRHGALPAGPGVVDALRGAREGQSVIEAVLERSELDADTLKPLHALAEQAFGQPDDGRSLPRGPGLHGSLA